MLDIQCNQYCCWIGSSMSTLWRAHSTWQASQPSFGAFLIRWTPFLSQTPPSSWTTAVFTNALTFSIWSLLSKYIQSICVYPKLTFALLGCGMNSCPPTHLITTPSKLPFHTSKGLFGTREILYIWQWLVQMRWLCTNTVMKLFGLYHQTMPMHGSQSVAIRKTCCLTICNVINDYMGILLCDIKDCQEQRN